MTSSLETCGALNCGCQSFVKNQWRPSLCLTCQHPIENHNVDMSLVDGNGNGIGNANISTSIKDFLNCVDEKYANLYAQKLMDEGYDDMNELKDATLEDLIHLGLKKVHAKKILTSIQDLVTSQSGPEPGSGLRPIAQQIHSSSGHNHAHHHQSNNGSGVGLMIGKAVNWLSGSGQSSNGPPVGWRPPQVVSVVLLGQTGTGKTTFKQSLRDYVSEVGFDQISTTKRTEGQAEAASQTQDVTLEESSGSRFHLKVIDTPGIGDTQGVKKDREHMENITAFLSNDCEFNAICVLIKNGENRLSKKMEYIVGEIRKNLTKDLWRHVFTIVTRCERSIASETVEIIRKLQLPTADGQIFSVDNWAYEKSAEGFGVVNESSQKRISYFACHNRLQLILEAAAKQPRHTGDGIRGLRERRKQCKDKGMILRAKISSIQSEQRSIQDQQKAIQTGQMTMGSLNGKRRTKVKRKETQVKPLPHPTNTVCLKPECRRVCHAGCSLPYGDWQGCYQFGTGVTHCKGCGHSVTSHHHTNQTHVEVEVVEDVVNHDVERQFNAAKSDVERKQILITAKQKKLRELEATKVKLIQDMATLNIEIESMAMIGFNESFEGYVEEAIASLKELPMDASLRNQMIREYEDELEIFKAMKEAYIRRHGV